MLENILNTKSTYALDIQVNVSKSQTKQPRMARANMHNLKSNLTKPQPTWWSASQRENLSIRTLTSEERSNLPFEDKREKWWTIEYSKSYRNVTKGFMDAVLSGGLFIE